MEQELKAKIVALLADVKPSLGGTDLRLINLSQGIVTVEYCRPLSNPSACHVDRTQITEDIIVEVLEDQLSKIIPDFKSVMLVGKDQ